jgi:hypothetical protein
VQSISEPAARSSSANKQAKHAVTANAILSGIHIVCLTACKFGEQKQTTAVGCSQQQAQQSSSNYELLSQQKMQRLKRNQTPANMEPTYFVVQRNSW